MTTTVSDEFQIGPFAKFYEQISDSFLDTKGAAESLKLHLKLGAEVFELGLGTGYFASMLTADGYVVRGIQPDDEMLPLLKHRHADVQVVAERKLEDYEFTRRHETIVSHSSVFLFTSIALACGRHGETLTSYIFQSFIEERAKVLECLGKALGALTPDGRLFVNIQTNPLPLAEVESAGEKLTFEMLGCEYFLDLGRVEKVFRLTYDGRVHEVRDDRFCATYSDFASHVSRLGFKASISTDRRWVIVGRAE